MAVLRGTIFSEALGMNTGLTVVTPRNTLIGGEPYKVIYILHGLSDDHTCWSDHTMLPLFSSEHNVVFIMPETQRCWYTDMKYGPNYFTYIADELPKICKQLFNISAKREDTAVMGLSMGGYGALKCALSRPEQYSVCCAFSSGCDLGQYLSKPDCGFYHELKACFGEDLVFPEEADLYRLAEKCIKSPEVPQFHMTCGLQDELLEDNHKLRDHMKNLGYPLEYQEWEGIHDWYFWNTSLKMMLDRYFPKEK